MARALVLYTTPPDPAAFDQHYTNVHIPLVHALPGLQKFELSTGTILSPTNLSGYHAIATLTFADMPRPPRRLLQPPRPGCRRRRPDLHVPRQPNSPLRHPRGLARPARPETKLKTSLSNPKPG